MPSRSSNATKLAPSVAIPEVSAPSLTLPLGEIIGQSRQHVAHLAAEIGLELEHRSAEKHIGAAADLGQTNLVVERRIGCPEAVTQDVRHQRAYGLVARSRGERGDELG